MQNKINTQGDVSQRAYSIRTRIKTPFEGGEVPFVHIVREHIPLEQGLRRHPTNNKERMISSVREHIPLEQGLRPFKLCSENTVLCIVREHIPLEQGLRLACYL